MVKMFLSVSLFPTYYGEKTVMRLLREMSQAYLEYLGFHGEGLKEYTMRLPSLGMILTGACSGKTTTLYNFGYLNQ
jgi:type II secretory ATPase GspE/PulE/Tfp pilus assembly ATPase PilB-like protein